MKYIRSRVPVRGVKLSLGQHVWISKMKMKFAKNRSIQITFKISKVMCRTPTTRLRAGGFQQDGNLMGTLWRGTDSCARHEKYYLQDRLNLGQVVRKGILDYLVRWKGYRKDLDTWVPAASVKSISFT